MDQAKSGKLIVLEGVDGSGKGTQAKLLLERLRHEGYQAATAAFPQYGKKSAGIIEEYLNGAYGKPDEISPYASSLFYALDRFDASRGIRQLIADGNAVVLDRYVDSNAGHQGGKIQDMREREAFLSWLYNIEFQILGVPKPDLTIILHVPPEISQQLVARKEARSYLSHGSQDGHEADLIHLKNAETAYLWLAKKFPQDHILIECVKNSKLLTPQEVHELVWKIVEKIV